MATSMGVESCLDDRIALDLITGRLDAIARERTRRHLDGCDDCQDLVAMLGAGTVEPAASATGSGGWPARGDDYRLGREIARGGMGLVVTARHRWLGRDVALKLADGSDPARFAREIRTAARLQHPAIVPVYDAGTLDGAPFYAMRPIDGEPLGTRISRAGDLAGRLALLPHVVAVADAIAYAHSQGVIHRDLKPSNVLVGSFGETQVIDWGLARLTHEADDAPGGDEARPAAAELTGDGAVLGTPAYMAPEQARGERADARSDVFAIGAILYELLVGASPAPAGSVEVVVATRASGEPIPVRARAAGAPRELIAIAERALDPDPARRYADAGELAADLHRLQAGLLVAAHHYTAGQLVRRWIRRHRVAVAALATGVIVAGVVGGVLVSRVIAARDTAEHERDTARVERAAAETVVFHGIDDVYDALDASGQYAAIDALGGRLVEYYDRVLAVRPGDAVSRGHRAVARDMQANAAFRTGDFPRAEQIWTEVIAVMRDVVVVDDTAAVDLGLVYNNLGGIARLRGDLATAAQHFTTAITELEPAFAANPTLMADALIAAHDGLAQTRMETLDTAGARPPIERAVEVGRLALAAQPADVALQLRVSSLDYLLGNLEALDGHRAAARAAFAHGVELADAARTAMPDDPSIATNAAFPRFGLVGVALSGEQLAEVDRLLGEMRGLIGAAREIGYADPQMARLELMIEVTVAQRELVDGRPAVAVAAASRAVAGFAALAEAQPEVNQLRRDHAQALALRARAHARAGHAGAAAADATAAVTVLAESADASRGELDLARAWLVAAEVGATVAGKAPAALVSGAIATVDRLDAATGAQAPIVHARAWAAAIAARLAPGDRAAAERYAAARAAVATAMPLATPTPGELDRIAGKEPPAR